MKNQMDLIFIGACALLSIIFATAFFFMKREPQAYPAPQQVITADPAYPPGTVTYVNNLSGGNNSSAGGGFGGMGSGGMGAGKQGFMSGMGGGPGGPGGAPGGQKKKMLPSSMKS